MSRTLVLAALLLCAARTAAQSIDVNADGNGVSIHIAPPASAPPGGEPAPAPPPPPAQDVGPRAMSDADLPQLVAAIEGEGFSEGKLTVLQSAARDAWFTVAQVGTIVDALSFSEDKVKAVALTRRHIVDHENEYKLFAHFPFDGDKQAVKKLLR